MKNDKIRLNDVSPYNRKALKIILSIKNDQSYSRMSKCWVDSLKNEIKAYTRINQFNKSVKNDWSKIKK